MINYARLLYGQTKETGTNLLRPRFTYEFTVTFITTAKDEEDKPVQFVVPAVSADYPTTSIDTITLNQYNRPRVVQTRLRFEPLSFTIYNTQDASTENFFKNLISFFYNQVKQNLGDSIINSFSPTPSPLFFGYKPGNTKYMFQNIVISRGYTGAFNNLDTNTQDKVDAISLEFPVITNLSGTSFNYSESMPQTLTVTVQPENVVIGNIDFKEKEELDE